MACTQDNNLIVATAPPETVLCLRLVRKFQSGSWLCVITTSLVVTLSEAQGLLPGDQLLEFLVAVSTSQSGLHLRLLNA